MSNYKRISNYHFTAGQNNVTAKKGMVASAHPLASQIGVGVLKQGGNAIDAAVATAFALAVVEPNASGPGGGGFLLIKMVAQAPVVIDYRDVAPAGATRDFYYNSRCSFADLATRGANAIAVPGMPAGLALALAKFGSKSLAELLQPAMTLAEKGFTVDEKLAALMSNHLDVLVANKAVAGVFLQNDRPLPVGILMQRFDLVKTFEVLINKGVAPFYHGTIARSMVQTIKENGGLVTLADLNSYKPVIRDVIHGYYRGFDIMTVPPPGSGIHLVQLLNILESFDLKKQGHNSGSYIHLFSEAIKQVYADRNALAADPGFYPVPVKQLTSKEYARRIWSQISLNELSKAVPGAFQDVSSHTTHLSVMDDMGNLVALTQSINNFFGAGILVPEWGILLNNTMLDFSPDPGSKNAVAPGKRPVSYMTPTLVFKDGKPFLTIGTPGGSRIITALAQILVNVIDFNMSIDAAIDAPRFHCQQDVVSVESRIDSEVINHLQNLGHTVQVRKDYDVFFGGAQGILIDAGTGILSGAADPRRSGVVIGYS